MNVGLPFDLSDLPEFTAPLTVAPSHPRHRPIAVMNLAGLFVDRGGSHPLLDRLRDGIGAADGRDAVLAREVARRPALIKAGMDEEAVIRQEDLIKDWLARLGPVAVLAEDTMVRMRQLGRQVARQHRGWSDHFQRLSELMIWHTRLEEDTRERLQLGLVREKEAALLAALVAQCDAARVLEIGIGNGLSTAYMAMALSRDGKLGRLHGIDLPMVHDPADPHFRRPPNRAGIIPADGWPGWLVPDAAAAGVRVLNRRNESTLVRLAREAAPIDLVLRDADNNGAAILADLEALEPHLADKAVIAVDDVAWTAALWTFADARGWSYVNIDGALGLAIRA